MEEHAENQSSTLEQDMETIKDPVLIPDKDLAELEQIEEIPTPPEHQKVHTLQTLQTLVSFSYEVRCKIEVYHYCITI